MIISIIALFAILAVVVPAQYANAAPSDNPTVQQIEQAAPPSQGPIKDRVKFWAYVKALCNLAMQGQDPDLSNISGTSYKDAEECVEHYKSLPDSPKYVEPEVDDDGAGGGPDENAPVAAGSGDGQALAEAKWGEKLQWPPELYSAHAGEEGFPDVCAGLCWDTHKVSTGKVMLWYGPNAGEEDITQSDAKFGDGGKGPLDLMRDGDVNVVIFPITKEAQLETCAIGTLDGVALTTVLGIKQGECGSRVAIQPGWHVVENNANSPIAGFGVRYTVTGWAGMTEAKIPEYTKYWQITADTGTFNGPDEAEVLMTPAMVSMMQDFGVLKKIVFTKKVPGQILLCNGVVTGAATLSSPDGSCHYYAVGAGTFTYTGGPGLSAGASWVKQ